MFSLTGDTKERRDLGYVSWDDPLASLEDSKSKVFRKTVRQEEAQFYKFLKGIDVTPWNKMYTSLTSATYPLSQVYAHTRIPWVYDTVIAIQKRPTSPTLAVWVLYGSKNVWYDMHVTSISYSKDGLLAAVRDIGSGSELLEVKVYELDSHRKIHPCWKRSPIGQMLSLIHI